MARCTRPFASLKPIQRDLDLVAHKAGNNWRRLLTNLGIELADIESFKDGRETKDACFKGLVHWLKGNVPDEPVTFGALFQALKDSAMTGCISLLEEKLEARSRLKSADQDLSTQTNSVKASSEVQDAVKLRQVQNELEELKFAEKESGHVKAKEQITLDVLFDMKHDQLKEIGVKAFGSRHKILKKCKEIQETMELDKVSSFMSRPAEEDAKVCINVLTPSDPKYTNVEDMMQRTVRNHEGSAGGVFTSYSINKIEQIHNTKLWKRFMYTREVIADTNSGDAGEVMLFHGSPYVHSIIQHGFDERHACPTRMFGAGIYFAEDSSKSNQYVYSISSRGCVAHSERSCYNCERVLLLCRVLLGKSHKQLSALRLSHAPPGHNSVYGAPSDGGLSYKEYVIYRGEQAYPEYVITYKIVAPDGKD